MAIRFPLFLALLLAVMTGCNPVEDQTANNTNPDQNEEPSANADSIEPTSPPAEPKADGPEVDTPETDATVDPPAADVDKKNEEPAIPDEENEDTSPPERDLDDRQKEADALPGIVVADVVYSDVLWVGENRIVVSSSSSLERWDVDTESRTSFSERYGYSRDLATTPTADVMVASGDEGSLIVCDKSTLKEIRRAKIGNADVRKIALSPDGSLIATAALESNVISLFNTDDLKPAGTLSGHVGEVQDLTFLDDQHVVSMSFQEDELIVWDTKTKQQVSQRESDGYVFRLAGFPDGKHVAVQNETGIAIWNWETKETIRELKSSMSHEFALTISPDGKLIVASSSGNLILWEVETGKQLGIFPAHIKSCYSCAFSSDGSRIVSVGAEWMRFWDVATMLSEPEKLQHIGDEVAVVTHGRWIGDMAFSPDGKRFAFSGYERPGHAVCLSFPEMKTSFEHVLDADDSTHAIEFTSKGKELAILCRQDHIDIFNVETGKLSRTVEGGPWGSDFQFAKDETQAIVTSKYGASLIDMNNGKSIRHFAPKKQTESQKFAYQPGSSWFAILSYNNQLNIYNVADGSIIKTIETKGYGNNIAASPNGELLAVATGESFKVFETSTWDVKYDLTQESDEAKAIAFSPDGKWMVTGEWRSSYLRDFDHLVKWDLATGKQIARFRAHVAEVTCVAISPDGEYIASGANNGMVRIWKTPK